MMEDQLKNDLIALECKIEPCGSRVTCNPPPADTDQDYLVEVPAFQNTVASVVNALGGAEYNWEGGEHYQNAMADGFMSWRKGDVNLIVTSNKAFAKRHRVATALCTRLNLMNKPDRIALFQAVLYGITWDGYPPAPEPAPIPSPDLGDDLPY